MNGQVRVGLDCEVCGHEFSKGEPVHMVSLDGLPGHEWLECDDCHRVVTDYGEESEL